MFEVIYISPSCKQAVNFINDLAIKLKQRGIDNVDIDHKNIQLKSDKFIVLAVDIWSMRTCRYYRYTKYFIDGVFANRSYMENKSGESLDKVLNKFGELETRFPKETKKISEEELIEILMEVQT